jgi:hypothetical protein
MRGFGRQCRGQGHVLVHVVRHTEQKLLQLGASIPALGQQAQHLLDQATTLSDAQRKRVTETFTAALSRHTQIRQQSTRLIRGQTLRHCKLVNAYDLTIAPILKGKSNCPAQFGRKPGIVSDPATGFISRYAPLEVRIKKGIDSRLGGENLCLSQCGYPSWPCGIFPTSRPVRP